MRRRKAALYRTERYVSGFESCTVCIDVPAVGLDLFPFAMDSAVGLREGGDRRHGDRRHHTRSVADRRRGERRRARLRSLVLAGLTMLFTPHGTKTTPPKPGVSVSVDEFRPVPADQAYQHLIQEAASTYDLDPALIRAVMKTESAFNPLVVSRVGAQGLMQLM